MTTKTRNSPTRITVECYQCRKKVSIKRCDVSYWPDHLWPGKVSASYVCPKCGKKTGKWAHELPVEWKADWPRPDWEEYCLPRLLDSCYLNSIRPKVFKEAMLPFTITDRHLETTWIQRLGRWLARP